MKDFSDQRLLNMLDQCYSYNEQMIGEVMNEIQTRKLLPEDEMKSRFEIGLKKGIAIQQKEVEDRELEAQKQAKRKKLNNTIYGVVIGASLIASILIWYFTGNIFILALSPTLFGGIALRERKTIFRR